MMLGSLWHSIISKPRNLSASLNVLKASNPQQNASFTTSLSLSNLVSRETAGIKPLLTHCYCSTLATVTVHWHPVITKSLDCIALHLILLVYHLCVIRGDHAVHIPRGHDNMSDRHYNGASWGHHGGSGIMVARGGTDVPCSSFLSQQQVIDTVPLPRAAVVSPWRRPTLSGYYRMACTLLCTPNTSSKERALYCEKLKRFNYWKVWGPGMLPFLGVKDKD